MTRTLLLVALLGVLTACATAQPPRLWYEAADPRDPDQTKETPTAHCLYESAINQQSIAYKAPAKTGHAFTDGMNAGRAHSSQNDTNRNHLFELCMQANGFTYTRDEAEFEELVGRKPVDF